MAVCQVVYVVLANNMWKHYGVDVLPVLTKHYQGLTELMDWFDRHADPVDGLLPPRDCSSQQCGACYGDWMGFDPESHKYVVNAPGSSEVCRLLCACSCAVRLQLWPDSSLMPFCAL